MRRRRFLRDLSLAAAGVWVPGRLLGRAASVPTALEADVLVVGGGVGGCAAALAAARSGRRVILTEETDWVGGQLTQQGVPPDEHPWIEQYGATASYRAFRDAVRAYYRRHYPLTGAAYREPALNPGGCWVSSICHEPRVALAVLEGMLAPHVSSGRLAVLTEHVPVRAETEGDRVRAVHVRDERTGDERVLRAPYVLDATELGDLLPLTGTAFVTGAEARSETGELHAAPEAQPGNMQAATWCFAMDYVPGADHTIERPARYDFWRDYVPALEPAWPGPLLALTYTHPIRLEPITLPFDPRPGAEAPGLWAYRRLTDPSRFEPEAYAGGTTLVNWPQNDYLLGNLFGDDPATTEQHYQEAMQLSLALCYWLQTEAPRPDDGGGWPGLRLRGDLMGTTHGLAKRPYVRESRRLRALSTVLEQHVGLEARMAATGLDEGTVTAARFPDSVGVGSYRIDLHPSTGGDNYVDVASLPFEIPLGALVPRRTENLLAAAKNIGTTHVTNGCYRLHPVEWNVGEAAGLLAAFCLERGEPPQAVHADEALLADFQRLLRAEGVETRWPEAARTAR